MQECSADDKQTIFSEAGFLGILRVKLLEYLYEIFVLYCEQ